MPLEFGSHELAAHVSIRARPRGRAMPERGRQRRHDLVVSIRARPRGRAMHDIICTELELVAFQSAPGLEAGRCTGHDNPQPANQGFNPRPA